MGFWARLIYGKERAGTEMAVSSPPVAPDRVMTLVGDKSVFVVGAEYVRRHSQRVPTDVEFVVELRRDPKNAHDKKATMVMFEGHSIGFFSSFNAEKYAPLIDIANKAGQAVHATATADEDLRGVIKTHVEMPTVYEFAVLLGPAARRIADANKPAISAVLKQLSKYQDQLSGILSGMDEREVEASLVLAETPSGKYKGQNMVKFFFQGEEIGVLPAQYRDAHEEFFEAAESGGADCMVLVRRYEERLWARAAM